MDRIDFWLTVWISIFLSLLCIVEVKEKGDIHLDEMSVVLSASEILSQAFWIHAVVEMVFF